MSRPYHHGDLRAALLAAALRAVEAGGHAALSLRELAQGLGVSHAAPYRHFPTREALLAAVASEGFARLAEAWLLAWQGAGPGHAAAGRLRVAARAYLGFATERPALFRLMFQGPPPAGAEAAFAGLQATVAAALPGAAEAMVKARTIAMWSALHGFAWLCLEGRLRPAMLRPLPPEAMLEAVLDAALGPLGKG